MSNALVQPTPLNFNYGLKLTRLLVSVISFELPWGTQEGSHSESFGRSSLRGQLACVQYLSNLDLRPIPILFHPLPIPKYDVKQIRLHLIVLYLLALTRRTDMCMNLVASL